MEILPLIDVIFCILTFFILGAVGLSRQQAITLDLPNAKTAAPQMREMVVVSLDEFNQASVDGEPVDDFDELKRILEGYQEDNPLILMALYASQDVTYNQVIRVLDAMREVGGDRVALATIPGDAPGSDEFTPGMPRFNNNQINIPNINPQGIQPVNPNPQPNPTPTPIPNAPNPNSTPTPNVLNNSNSPNVPASGQTTEN
ncbi:MAG: biopolymer transporter ExbD [Synechococcaceae cyanobacterium RL_1_2]|nr:biopolymer transporter ExbD [Synechococcaceae cyanobacterium RL_1_2]